MQTNQIILFQAKISKNKFEEEYKEEMLHCKIVQMSLQEVSNLRLLSCIQPFPASTAAAHGFRKFILRLDKKAGRGRERNKF